MCLQVILRVLLLHLAATTAQFMPHMPQMAQMPHGSFPFFGNQGQQMHVQMPHGLPGGMQVGLMPNMPHLPGMQPSMHMPSMQLPLNTGGRLPMVVMPHYTKKNEKKRKPKKAKKHNRKHYKGGSSSDEESCSSEEHEYISKNDLRSSKKKRQEILTPVVSYVTKDGYVIYQKKIRKEKAKDWLELAKDRSEEFFEKVPRSKKHHVH